MVELLGIVIAAAVLRGCLRPHRPLRASLTCRPATSSASSCSLALALACFAAALGLLTLLGSV